MEELRQTAAEPVKEPETAPAPEQKVVTLAPGEKVFAYVLLAFGLACVFLSAKLWAKMDAPKISSAAAVPMIVSCLWVVLDISIIIGERKMRAGTSGTILEKMKTTIEYIFPIDFVVLFAATIAYCVTLFLGLGFYIATPIYLWATICYLQKKDILKNILWTGIIMLFIFLVFDKLFGVVVP